MRLWIITVALCLTGVICLGAGSKAKGLLISFHLEGDQTDSAKFVTPVKLGSEHRQYFFRKMPEFSDNDIAWFYPFVSQDGGSFGAAFRLKNAKAEELTLLTTANHGKLLGTRVLDAPLRAVVIDRPISDGVVVIWDGLSKNHLKLIGQKIPHSDKFQGLQSVPSFNLPGTKQNPQQPTPETSPAPAKKKPFSKLFGNSNRKSNTNSNGGDSSANPYAKPQ